MKHSEARRLSEYSEKELALEYLEEMCDKVRQVRGSIKIFLSLEPCIERQVQRCYDKGATVNEIRNIINKFK